ncbi:MAG: carbamoyltransferase HypF, partial [Planctomycetes bacterium]|nr:carbamoyltransferase HypF [Planctomycetota bacterium]
MADIQSDARRFNLQVTGQVQGVGFRPFAYRLAQELKLGGWILNDEKGVMIEVQGASQAIETFVERLRTELPPLASIANLRRREVRLVQTAGGFEIRTSAASGPAQTQVTVDTATCRDCLREMKDPGDPRYAYPFINCTNCGPRFTILKRIPYDRPNTTMADFTMCELCAGEYRDPASRRFHAQPIACPKCGPQVSLTDGRGREIPCREPITQAAAMLSEGRVLAIKGLGGFHLACRADDEHVVARLRRRKGRDAKPFAIMVADLAQAELLCELNDSARRLLRGAIRPIVVCPSRPRAAVAESVAHGLTTLGIMLPYTPVHHLLFAHGLGPLVMTSGNHSEEPLVKDNESALTHLAKIADAFLMHNRRIERRLDDSVVQIHADGSPGILRRARGYAPQPIRIGALKGPYPAVLAVGAELKNTICLLSYDNAVLSGHIGDLKEPASYRHFIDTIDHLEKLFEIEPLCIAADLHPQYLSSEYALRRHRGRLGKHPAIPIVRVQHHHAHAASCLAENGYSGEAIALVCDGVGLGDDGAVWGCEIMRVNLARYERLGHLRYSRLPGGDAAARQTYRPAAGVVYDTFGADAAARLEGFTRGRNDERTPGRRQFDSVVEMLEAGVNSPLSSSLGRWFDAVAWMCGLAEANNFQGEAPMILESAMTMPCSDSYAFELVSEKPFLIDLRPTVEQIAADVSCGLSPGEISARFHNTVVAFLLAAAKRARRQTN